MKAAKYFIATCSLLLTLFTPHVHLQAEEPMPEGEPMESAEADEPLNYRTIEQRKHAEVCVDRYGSVTCRNGTRVGPSTLQFFLS